MGETFVGFTDDGKPLVLAEGGCAYFSAGRNRLLSEPQCWYCRYADFRKSVDVALNYSVCRCPGNLVHILAGNRNEQLEEMQEQGGNYDA